MTKRDDIIDAARRLMQARESRGFSMRTLAEVAGVSIATPYNLFGSKHAIIAAVMDADLNDFREALFAETKSEIDIFFHMVDVSAELFSRSPGYYKSGLGALETDADPALANHFGTPRHELLRDLVSRAVQAGYLAHCANPDSVAIALGQQFYGWTQAWARGHIPLEDMVSRTHHVFALTLAGAASADQRDALFDRAMALQDLLPEATMGATAPASTDHSTTHSNTREAAS